MQLAKKGIYKKIVWGFHCDVYQHVNNARYLEFLEEARWDYTKPLHENDKLKSKGWMTIVVHLDVSYKLPLMLADEIEIHTSIEEIGKKSLTFHQKIFKNNGELLCTLAKIKFVIFDRKTNNALIIDDEIKQLFNV